MLCRSPLSRYYELVSVPSDSYPSLSGNEFLFAMIERE